jgi:hypothetical protein
MENFADEKRPPIGVIKSALIKIAVRTEYVVSSRARDDGIFFEAVG